MRIILNTLYILVPMLFLIGCSTYYIPLESFKEQFREIDSTKLKMVTINGPLFANLSYSANSIDTIICLDSKNNPVKLANSPSIEMRVTEDNDESTIFYFDTVYLQDTMIVGSKSRFIPSLQGAIPLKRVKLIEVQDGGKNFHYIKKD